MKLPDKQYLFTVLPLSLHLTYIIKRKNKRVIALDTLILTSVVD